MKTLKKYKRIIYILLMTFFVVGILCFKYAKDNKENYIEIANFTNEIVENKNVNDDKENKNDITEQQIYVHIIGEVEKEGVVVLKKGERVIDAIEKAGGVKENADLSKVNLAYKLSDGQKIRIPNINEIEVDYNNDLINDFTGLKNEQTNKVNINTATQTELETLTGIGPSLASKIISYRKKNGNFSKIEEIKNVSGIGEEKYEGIKNEIEV